MKNFINWEDIDLRGKTSGQTKTKCPHCVHTSKDKSSRDLSVNISKGLANCHRCESVSIKDNIQAETKKEYKLPVQEWRNYTKLSDKLVKYLEGRKINQSTAIELGWTEELYWQPSKNKKVTNLVFNTFEGDVLVNKKYRSGDKKFTQSAGTKSIFYNINSAIGQKELYIVEGEMDVASLYEVGIKNVVSVPNGANDNDDFWINSEKYIKDIEQFVIAVDNDTKGEELKNAIAHRLGRHRCTFIEFKGKDANDDLNSLKLSETAFNKKRFPVSGTFRISDLYDGVLDLYDNGLPKTIYPKSKYFGNLKDIYSEMLGQLVVATGMPSHGKSTFTDWKVLNLIKDYNFKASWFSPEHSPMELYHSSLSEKVIGKNFWKQKGNVGRMTKEDLEKYHDWANDKIYLTDCDGGQLPTWDWLLDKFKEQMYSFGINIFVIDAFNKVLLPKGNKLEQINIVLTKLTHFAQANNVLIYLVAHPTKMKKSDDGVYDVPTLYDVSGSADFRNQTHCGYTIYRTFATDTTDDYTSFYNMKTKFSFQGEIGAKVDFKYCDINGRYYTEDSGLPIQSLIDDKEPDFTIPLGTTENAFKKEQDDEFDQWHKDNIKEEEIPF